SAPYLYRLALHDALPTSYASSAATVTHASTRWSAATATPRSSRSSRAPARSKSSSSADRSPAYRSGEPLNRAPGAAPHSWAPGAPAGPGNRVPVRHPGCLNAPTPHPRARQPPPYASPAKPGENAVQHTLRQLLTVRSRDRLPLILWTTTPAPSWVSGFSHETPAPHPCWWLPCDESCPHSTRTTR